MDLRELRQVCVAFGTMVEAFLTGPIAQRQPRMAEAWLREMRQPIAFFLAQKGPFKVNSDEWAERTLIRSLDKVLRWVLLALPDLGPDEAAAFEAVRPYVDIVLRETEQRRMGAIIGEWASMMAYSPAETSKAEDKPE